MSDHSVVEEPQSGVSKPPPVLMWEVRVAEGRLEDLIAYAKQHADPSAEIYAAHDPDRLVLIDPSGLGLPDVPGDLVARPAHAWPFGKIAR
ncbi:MAG TPA: hypothetical protein VGL26_04055 [Jatrophihabitans sp.]|jgi:hypothetical protein